MSSFAGRYHDLKCTCANLLTFIPPFSSAMAFLEDSKLSHLKKLPNKGFILGGTVMAKYIH